MGLKFQGSEIFPHNIIIYFTKFQDGEIFFPKYIKFLPLNVETACCFWRSDDNIKYDLD